MKPRTKNPLPPKRNEDVDALVADLGPDVVRQLYRAYKLTAAAIYKRAAEQAEAQLQEPQDS
jgi:hypothetical protein